MYSGHEVDREWMLEAARLLANLVERGDRLGIVVGGGYLARKNIAEAKKSGVTDTSDLDLVGIAATRENARHLASSLSEIGIQFEGEIPTTTARAAELMEAESVVIMGGTTPGHTTDAVAISLAGECKAMRCVIATNVDYIYDKHPQQYSDAVPFERMTLNELQGIVGPPEHRGAGPNVVVDPIAVQIAIDNEIELALMNGKNILELANCLSHKPFIGTVVEVDE